MANVSGTTVRDTTTKRDEDDRLWFTEVEAMWRGQRFSLEVEEILYHQASEYQNIQVLQTSKYGRVLVLDGVIQFTEFDEFAYHEMMAHVPLFCHPNPVSVLVVGGGDGGVTREALKHPSVERVTVVDIDKDVVSVAKSYFADSTAVAFENEAVDVRCMDAAVYVREHKDEFDVIIVDSADPVGPAEALFSETFYRNLRGALRSGGIVCAQGESQWLHLDLIHETLRMAKKHFEHVEYSSIYVPTYPSGQIGLIVASNAQFVPFWLRQPKRWVPKEVAATLKYYSEGVHETSFVLPRFVRDRIEGITGPNGRPDYGIGPSIHSLLAGAAGVGVVAGLGIGAAVWAVLRSRERRA